MMLLWSTLWTCLAVLVIPNGKIFIVQHTEYRCSTIMPILGKFSERMIECPYLIFLEVNRSNIDIGQSIIFSLGYTLRCLFPSPRFDFAKNKKKSNMINKLNHREYYQRFAFNNFFMFVYMNSIKVSNYYDPTCDSSDASSSPSTTVIWKTILSLPASKFHLLQEYLAEVAVRAMWK